MEKTMIELEREFNEEHKELEKRYEVLSSMNEDNMSDDEYNEMLNIEWVFEQEELQEYVWGR